MRVIYALEGLADMKEAPKHSAPQNFWSELKGKAIATELARFYSQYEGQSWKNVISIGDSDFERFGTWMATTGYMQKTGIRQSDIERQGTVELKGHTYKVRTKTFKMLGQPTVQELTVELAMVQKWLPLMVKLDDSFDINLNNVDDVTALQTIEQTLRGGNSSRG